MDLFVLHQIRWRPLFWINIYKLSLVLFNNWSYYSLYWFLSQTLMSVISHPVRMEVRVSTSSRDIKVCALGAILGLTARLVSKYKNCTQNENWKVHSCLLGLMIRRILLCMLCYILYFSLSKSRVDHQCYYDYWCDLQGFQWVHSHTIPIPLWRYLWRQWVVCRRPDWEHLDKSTFQSTHRYHISGDLACLLHL